MATRPINGHTESSGPATIRSPQRSNKVALIAAVSKDLTTKGLSAGDCVKVAAKLAGGGGGGRPDLAEAGGKDITKLTEALAAGASYFRTKLA